MRLRFFIIKRKIRNFVGNKNIKILVKWLICLLILLFLCFVLQPDINHFDFLNLSITIFSISVVLITFVSPILSKFRKEYLELLKASVEKLYKNKNVMSRELEYLSFKDKIERLEDWLRSDLDGSIVIKSVAIENTCYDMVKEFFENIQKQIKACLFVILLLIAINILFNSQLFINAIHFKCPFISDFSYWRIGITAFINFSSLLMQLNLLYRVCNVTMNTIKNLIHIPE